MPDQGEAQARWFSQMTGEGRQSWDQAPDPARCPHRAHCLPPTSETDLAGPASPGLPGPRPTNNNPLGTIRGVAENGGQIGYRSPQVVLLKSGCASERRFLCGHFWGPRPVPRSIPPTSSPSAWCNPSCYYTVVTRPSGGSWCPGSELTLTIYSSFPRATGREQDSGCRGRHRGSASLPRRAGQWVLEAQSLRLSPALSLPTGAICY